MVDSKDLANSLLALWDKAVSEGVDGDTSVNAFTSSMWAKLVVRGASSSEKLDRCMAEAVSELQDMFNRYSQH